MKAAFVYIPLTAVTNISKALGKNYSMNHYAIERKGCTMKSGIEKKILRMAMKSYRSVANNH